MDEDEARMRLAVQNANKAIRQRKPGEELDCEFEFDEIGLVPRDAVYFPGQGTRYVSN